MPEDKSTDHSDDVISSKLQTLYDTIDSCSDDSTLGTYKLKLRPTNKQKLTLRRILAASNMAWNWTKWLIEEKGFSKNDRKGLQKIVTNKRITADFTPKEVLDNQDLLAGTSTVRLTGMANFISALKGSVTLHKGRIERFNIDRKELYPISGTVTVQKLYINRFYSGIRWSVRIVSENYPQTSG